MPIEKKLEYKRNGIGIGTESEWNWNGIRIELGWIETDLGKNCEAKEREWKQNGTDMDKERNRN